MSAGTASFVGNSWQAEGSVVLQSCQLQDWVEIWDLPPFPSPAGSPGLDNEHPLEAIWFIQPAPATHYPDSARQQEDGFSPWAPFLGLTRKLL